MSETTYLATYVSEFEYEDDPDGENPDFPFIITKKINSTAKIRGLRPNLTTKDFDDNKDESLPILLSDFIFGTYNHTIYKDTHEKVLMYQSQES